MLSLLLYRRSFLVYENLENVVSLCFCSFMLPGQYFSFPRLLLSELLYLARTGVRGQTFCVPGVGISLPYANPNLKPSFLPIISLSFPQARHQIGCKNCSVINILHFSASVCFKTLIFFCHEHIFFLFFLASSLMLFHHHHLSPHISLCPFLSLFSYKF